MTMSNTYRWTCLVFDTSVLYLSLRVREAEKLLYLITFLIVSNVKTRIEEDRQYKSILQVLPHIYVPEAVKLELSMKLLISRAYCEHCRKSFTLPDYSRVANCPYCGQPLRILPPTSIENYQSIIERFHRTILTAYRIALESSQISRTEIVTSRGRIVPVRPIDTFIGEDDIALRYVHLYEPHISDVLDLAIELRKHHEEIMQRDYTSLPKSMFDYLITASALYLAYRGHIVCLISVGKDLARQV